MLHNLLSGPVPQFVYGAASIGAQSYVINFGLCGGPLEQCKSSSSPRVMLLLLNLVNIVVLLFSLNHSNEKIIMYHIS